GRELSCRLGDIGAIHTGGDHIDQDLPGAGDGVGDLGQLEPGILGGGDGAPGHRVQSPPERPRPWAAGLRAAWGVVAARPPEVVIPSSSPTSSSRARASQARSRSGSGASTEFTPARVMPRRMNGSTVVGRSGPWTRP